MPQAMVSLMPSSKIVSLAWRCAIWLLLRLSSACGAGRDHSGGPDLTAAGWREIEVSGKKANQFVGHPDGSIEVISSSSVSRLYRPVEVDLKATPVDLAGGRPARAADRPDAQRKTTPR